MVVQASWASAKEKADRTRTLRRALKEDIANGRASVKGYILAPPEFINTMTIYDLLMAKPKWGKVKVLKLLRSAVVPPTKEIGELTDRQRDRIVELLPW